MKKEYNYGGINKVLCIARVQFAGNKVGYYFMDKKSLGQRFIELQFISSDSNFAIQATKSSATPCYYNVDNIETITIKKEL